MRNRNMLTVISAGVALIGLYGCPKPTETQRSLGQPAALPAGKRLRIAVIPKGTSHSFWQTVKAGADAAGAEEKVEIVWQGPAKENNYIEQIDVVQAQVTSGVDGMVLAATDAAALVKPVQEAMKKIPVVTIDSGLKEPVSLCYIATDNVEGGRRAADSLAKLIGEKGKVGLLIFLKGAASRLRCTRVKRGSSPTT